MASRASLAIAVAARSASGPAARAFASSASARAAAQQAPALGGINNPENRSPYSDESLSTEQELTFKQRLARVPLLSRFIKDDAPKPKAPEPPKWAPKPRINGVYHHKIKFYLSSPNITVDKFPVATLAAPAPKPSGLGGRFGQYMKDARKASQSSMAQIAIRKEMPGFSPDKFALLAAEVYAELTSAFFAGRSSVLRQLTTEKVCSRMKRDMKARLGNGKRPTNAEYNWTLHEFVVAPELVQMRAFPVRNEDDMWAQITVKFHSIQSLTVTAPGKPNTVAQRLPVVEYWVFERCLRSKDALWRVCDQLKVPDAAAAASASNATAPAATAAAAASSGEGQRELRQ